MRRTSVAALLSMLIAGIGCNDAPDEAERPATFGDDCTLGADLCEDPFVCLEVQDFSTTGGVTSICTLTCLKNEDCPVWEEIDGPCQGDHQSECVRQTCRLTCS